MSEKLVVDGRCRPVAAGAAAFHLQCPTCGFIAVAASRAAGHEAMAEHRWYHAAVIGRTAVVKE